MKLLFNLDVKCNVSKILLYVPWDKKKSSEKVSQFHMLAHVVCPPYPKIVTLFKNAASINVHTQKYLKQECIPVGCVPAARRLYAGVCFPGGGVCSRGGVCLGGSAPRGRGCLLPGGICSGGPAPGGVCSRGGGIPACTEADPPL